MNRKPKSDYSTVRLEAEDFIDGLTNYVEEHDWISWVPSTSNILKIQKNESSEPVDKLTNLNAFISWVQDRGCCCCYVNKAFGDIWEYQGAAKIV